MTSDCEAQCEAHEDSRRDASAWRSSPLTVFSVRRHPISGGSHSPIRWSRRPSLSDGSGRAGAARQSRLRLIGSRRSPVTARIRPRTGAADLLKRPDVFPFESACANGRFGSRYRSADLTLTTAFTGRSASQLLCATAGEYIRNCPLPRVVVKLPTAMHPVFSRLRAPLFDVLLSTDTGEGRDAVLTDVITSGRNSPRR